MPAPETTQETLRQLNGATRLTAIFGDPVEHSQSPAMHNAAYAALGLNRAYVAFHVTPPQLETALRAIPVLGLLGVNLTVPHKQAALPLMATLSDEARLLEAINCVVNRDGRLYGDNTDARGLELDLQSNGISVGGSLVVIIGAGGAAASAVLASIRRGAGRIVIANRTLSRAEQLAERFAKQARGTASAPATITAAPLEALAAPGALADAAVVVNATSVGLDAGDFNWVAYRGSPAGCVFYDLIYAAAPTPFMRPALALGRRALDGAGMLINQGVLAFALFNGVAPPDGVMRRALMERLAR